MRGIGKFVTLPFFSGGCASRSSIATISTSQIRELKGSELNPSVARREESEVKMKNTSGFFVVLPNISNGVHKLLRTLKTFSQLFVLRKEEDEEEMEIGYPTDVKHVTHIGLDGSTTTTTTTTTTTSNNNNNNNMGINNIIMGWENNNNNLNFVPPPDFLSFPPISLRQFELSMAAQTQPPLLHT